MGKPKQTLEKTRNLVAKHAPSFHRAQTHLNKKAALKRGKMKHIKGGFDLIGLLCQTY